MAYKGIINASKVKFDIGIRWITSRIHKIDMIICEIVIATGYIM